MGQITTTIQIYFKIEFNKQQTIANIFLCPATIYIQSTILISKIAKQVTMLILKYTVFKVLQLLVSYFKVHYLEMRKPA